MSLFAYASTVIRRFAATRYTLACRDCVKTVKRTSTSFTTKPLHDVNTNVSKDVILFKYDNPKYFKYMNLFAVVQYMFWTYLGMYAYKSLRDAPVDRTKIDENTPWFRKINLGENKYRNGLATISIVIGAGSLAMIWMYTLKSVKYLVLNKGGTELTFVTYSPFGQNRLIRVPLKYISCKESRSNARVQLPIKVKNRWMHYMLDMKGEFKNPILFDATAGLYRKID